MGVVPGLSGLGKVGAPRIAGAVTMFARMLTEDEAKQGVEAGTVATKPVYDARNALQKIRASHHELARVLSNGATDIEAGLVTSYSPGTIRILRNDPAFKELMAYYAGQKEQIYADHHRMLADLGIEASAELLDRLRDAPEKLSVAQLIEISKMGLDRTVAPPKTSGGFGLGITGAPGGGVNIKINFVDSPEPPMIDLTPEQAA